MLALWHVLQETTCKHADGVPGIAPTLSNLWTEVWPVADRPDVEDVVEPKEGQETKAAQEEFPADDEDLFRAHLFDCLCHCEGRGGGCVCESVSESEKQARKDERV